MTKTREVGVSPVSSLAQTPQDKISNLPVQKQPKLTMKLLLLFVLMGVWLTNASPQGNSNRFVVEKTVDNDLSEKAPEAHHAKQTDSKLPQDEFQKVIAEMNNAVKSLEAVEKKDDDASPHHAKKSDLNNVAAVEEIPPIVKPVEAVVPRKVEVPVHNYGGTTGEQLSAQAYFWKHMQEKIHHPGAHIDRQAKRVNVDIIVSGKDADSVLKKILTGLDKSVRNELDSQQQQQQRKGDEERNAGFEVKQKEKEEAASKYDVILMQYAQDKVSRQEFVGSFISMTKRLADLESIMVKMIVAGIVLVVLLIIFGCTMSLSEKRAVLALKNKETGDAKKSQPPRRISRATVFTV